MKCRGCNSEYLNKNDFICDLGSMPLANALLNKDQLFESEAFYPHRPLVCRECKLIQLPNLPSGTVFTEDYPFFSGTSLTWYDHAGDLASEAIRRCNLMYDSRVLEIGSNDGTLLWQFRASGIKASIGVEPCLSVAQHAIMEGIPTFIDFWNTETADKLGGTLGSSRHKHWKADLIVATNVLAHVPDLGDFLQGVQDILAPGGSVVFEFAYAGDMLKTVQFEQIYAEHYSYFSLYSLERALGRAGLVVSDVQHLDIHGGSLRVWAQRFNEGATNSVQAFRELEISKGMLDNEIYSQFSDRLAKRKKYALKLILEAASNGRVVGYGASAKAIVALNYFGVGPELVDCIIDTTPAKQGKYTPGTHIPIVSPEDAQITQNDTVINFLWNWRSESENNIRHLCSRVPIIYLRPEDSIVPVKAAA